MTATTDYIEASEQAMVFNPATASEAVVAGLNNIQLPGIMRGEVNVNEFRKYGVTFAGSGTFGNFSFSGQFVPDDTSGQTAVITSLDAKTKETTLRFYMNNTASSVADFCAPDLIYDSNAGWQFTSYEPGGAGIDSVIPVAGKGVTNGRFNYYMHHLKEEVEFSTTSSTTVATSPTGSFVTSGFLVGQSVIVDQLAGANSGKQGKISAVSASNMTLTSSNIVTQDTTGSGTVVHSGTIVYSD